MSERSTFMNITSPTYAASMLPIPVKRLVPNAVVPWLGTPGAAAVDLCAIESGFIPARETCILPVGLAMEIPEGYVGLICSRSGLAAKNAVFVLNAPGVIDSDYRGEIKIILINSGTNTFYYKAGDRIAQMMFIRHESPAFTEVYSLSDTERGEGGFGSTGIAAL